MEKDRMEALSDGIFAIALTILILEIKLPNLQYDDLSKALIGMFPKVLSYALSFITIGMYWVAHHMMTSYILKIDRNSLWLNLLNLLIVCFIPFPTAILGDYPGNPLSIVFYSFTLSLVNITGTVFWLYTQKLEENKSILPRKTVQVLAIVHILPVVFYSIASVLSFINRSISLVFLVIVPVFFILPNPIMNYLMNRAIKEDNTIIKPK